MLDPQQAREDARQVRAMLAKFPAEQVHVHRDWASRLAAYAERLARLREGLADWLSKLSAADSSTAWDMMSKADLREMVVKRLTALLGEAETDEGGA